MDDKLKKIAYKWAGGILKRKKIQSEIDCLQKISFRNLPILGVARFLLLAQWVEYELKVLYCHLVLFASIGPTQKPRLKPLSIQEIEDDRKLTLGLLIKSIERFDFQGSVDLIKKLKLFVDKRNSLTHKFFSDEKSLSKLSKEARVGTNEARVLVDQIKNTDEQLFS